MVVLYVLMCCWWLSRFVLNAACFVVLVVYVLCVFLLVWGAWFIICSLRVWERCSILLVLCVCFVRMFVIVWLRLSAVLSCCFFFVSEVLFVCFRVVVFYALLFICVVCLFVLGVLLLWFVLPHC